MSKQTELYRSKLHSQDKSHDVLIFKDGDGIRCKTTYECYNASERFTGEMFINGKWEHTFSLHDLGEEPRKSFYVHRSGERLERTESLIKKGKTFFNLLK